MDIIQERIHSLKEMLEELFLFTKLKNETYRMDLEPHCINQILKKTIFSYYDEWTAKGIVPDVYIPEEPMYVKGNEPAIQRIFQNVIKNALDHGAEGIGISMEEDNGRILIRIRNQVGDPEQINVNKVFERFYKADEARSRTSSGLGLSIARSLTQLQNGEFVITIDGDLFKAQVIFEEERQETRAEMRSERAAEEEAAQEGADAETEKSDRPSNNSLWLECDSRSKSPFNGKRRGPDPGQNEEAGIVGRKKIL